MSIFSGEPPPKIRPLAPPLHLSATGGRQRRPSAAADDDPFSLAAFADAVRDNPLPLAAALVAAVVVYWLVMGNEASAPSGHGHGGGAPGEEEEEQPPPRGYTLAQLREFDGSDGKRILIAVRGKVYDMTARGRDFYGPGGGYHVFAGRDATRGLAKMSLDAADMDDPRVDDLSLSELDALQGWVTKFESKYRVVGHLVREPPKKDYTLAELREYDGTHGDKTVLFVMRGKVFDVTNGWSFYGPGGGYAILAGRDASRALAKMSLDVADVDDPHVDDLTAEENKTLDEWIEKLGKKYPVLGNLVSEGEAAAAAGEGKGEGSADGASATIM